jgi:hypothetical protein
MSIKEGKHMGVHLGIKVAISILEEWNLAIRDWGNAQRKNGFTV